MHISRHKVLNAPIYVISKKGLKDDIVYDHCIRCHILYRILCRIGCRIECCRRHRIRYHTWWQADVCVLLLTSLAVHRSSWSTQLLLLQIKEVHCTRNLSFKIHVRIYWGTLIEAHWNGICSPGSLAWQLLSWKGCKEKSVEVLELLKSNLPLKDGVTNAWKFEKAHSILHKVLELILFGWSKNFSKQTPNGSLTFSTDDQRHNATLWHLWP